MFKREEISNTLPRHLAVIMDGNGRWAKRKGLPRAIGHKKGLEATKQLVTSASDYGIKFLTLFAFSMENAGRPKKEVDGLFGLAGEALVDQAETLNNQNFKVQFIGDRTSIPRGLQNAFIDTEKLTENNSGMVVTIAFNYSGRWDILQAIRKSVLSSVNVDQLGERDLSVFLQTNELPEPDLLIRTGGEKRISNFMLWDLAYTELFFTDCLWPDFGSSELELAMDDYRSRERRFGKTTEQLGGRGV
ncbi:MAG: polyprenyl diphosphate synthase [Betaproteobacteria bacterium]